MTGTQWGALLFGAALISGCTEGTQNSDIPSRGFVASQAAISSARQSAEICARHAPDGRQAIASLKAAGFKKAPGFTREREVAVSPRSGDKSLEYLERADHGVVVYIYSHIPDVSDAIFLDTFFCSIAVKHLSVEQAHQLAQTWVVNFQATQETLFRGVHVQNQVLGLQALTETSKVQIHTLRSSSHIQGRGAAIVLQHQERGVPSK